jgi:hypothetical protein
MVDLGLLAEGPISNSLLEEFEQPMNDLSSDIPF